VGRELTRLEATTKPNSLRFQYSPLAIDRERCREKTTKIMRPSKIDPEDTARGEYFHNKPHPLPTFIAKENKYTGTNAAERVSKPMMLVTIVIILSLAILNRLLKDTTNSPQLSNITALLLLIHIKRRDPLLDRSSTGSLLQ